MLQMNGSCVIMIHPGGNLNSSKASPRNYPVIYSPSTSPSILTIVFIYASAPESISETPELKPCNTREIPLVTH